MNGNDTRALERLSEAGKRYAALVEDLEEARAQRDAAILVCYRRGVSMRIIADAARIHYTRVKQITDAIDEASADAGMINAHPDPDAVDTDQ